MDDNEKFLLFPEYGENKAITGQKKMSNKTAKRLCPQIKQVSTILTKKELEEGV